MRHVGGNINDTFEKEHFLIMQGSMTMHFYAKTAFELFIPVSRLTRDVERAKQQKQKQQRLPVFLCVFWVMKSSKNIFKKKYITKYSIYMSARKDDARGARGRNIQFTYQQLVSRKNARCWRPLRYHMNTK